MDAQQFNEHGISEFSYIRMVCFANMMTTNIEFKKLFELECPIDVEIWSIIRLGYSAEQDSHQDLRPLRGRSDPGAWYPLRVPRSGAKGVGACTKPQGQSTDQRLVVLESPIIAYNGECWYPIEWIASGYYGDHVYYQIGWGNYKHKRLKSGISFKGKRLIDMCVRAMGG